MLVHADDRALAPSSMEMGWYITNRLNNRKNIGIRLVTGSWASGKASPAEAVRDYLVSLGLGADRILIGDSPAHEIKKEGEYHVVKLEFLK